MSDEKETNQDMESKEPASKSNDSGGTPGTSKFISPLGALLAGVCFFLPWIQCGNQIASGADLGEEIWIVFVAAAVILGSFFFFNYQKAVEKAKPIIIISSAIALVLMIYKYFKLKNDEVGQIAELEIKYGAIGTFLGFLVALIGSFFLKKNKGVQ